MGRRSVYSISIKTILFTVAAKTLSGIIAYYDSCDFPVDIFSLRFKTMDMKQIM